MRTTLLSIVSMLFAAWSVQAVERLDPSQLPASVRKALHASAANEPVKEVTIRTAEGQTIYDVELQRAQGPNPHLRISAEGIVLHDSRRSAADPTALDAPLHDPELGTPVTISKLKLDELPGAAQQAIKKEAAGREIAEITSATVDGRAAYKVEYRESGRNTRFYVGNDGTLLRPAEKPRVLGIGTTFEGTPAAVQETIRREMAGGEIVKIHKESLRAEAAFYRVDVRNAQGIFQLEITESGKVLRDSRR